jgi:hypothetical protein
VTATTASGFFSFGCFCIDRRASFVRDDGKQPVTAPAAATAFRACLRDSLLIGSPCSGCSMTDNPRR